MSLGGQESTAVDQECMLSHASSLSFWPVIPCLAVVLWNRFPVGAKDSSQ